MRYIVFDTETTGVDANKQAVDVGLIEIDPVTLEEKGRCSSLIMPTVPITPEAQAVHGISMDMLLEAGAPTIEQWVQETFGEGGMEGEVALIGHRIDFDKPLFAPIGRCAATVDTLLLWMLFGNVPTVDPETGRTVRKLDVLKEALGLPGGGQSHRAMADTDTALQLLRYVLPLTGRTLEEIAMTETFVLHEMPWGKHEGKPLIHVPRGYREWLLEPERSASLDRHLRYSLEQVAKADFPLPPKRAPGTVSAPSQRRSIFIPPRRKPT